jgi:hypothetical protein
MGMSNALGAWCLGAVPSSFVGISKAVALARVAAAVISGRQVPQRAVVDIVDDSFGEGWRCGPRGIGVLAIKKTGAVGRSFGIKCSYI